MKFKIKLFSLLLIAFTYSCNEDSPEIDISSNAKDVNSRFIHTPMDNFSVDLSSDNSSALKSSLSSEERYMNAINAELKNQGSSLQLSMIESYAMDGEGNTVYFNNRGNKQLGADFVPGDPRRGGFMDIAYASDGTEGATSSGLSQGDTDGAILRAMNTWDSVDCSNGLELNNLGSTPFDLGYVQFLLGLGGEDLFTDIMHSGFNQEVIDEVFGAGSNVLGVTFTFIWTDGDGPTDIDNNGKQDTALRDIYYNDAFPWAIGANFDVETVVLHESGHGLSQGHFGKAFRNNGNDKLHFSPLAVMNAGYSGIQTSITKTDNAGHCSNWAQWPNN